MNYKLVASRQLPVVVVRMLKSSRESASVSGFKKKINRGLTRTDADLKNKKMLWHFIKLHKFTLNPSKKIKQGMYANGWEIGEKCREKCRILTTDKSKITNR